MKPLHVLAAGSLRHVWPALMSAFQHHYPAGIVTHFGPAGLLRQRIEQGEQCDLFVSASMVHPQALQRAGLCGEVAPCCHNTLCLSLSSQVTPASWQELLRNPELRVAISTPGCDPCGDYAWQLFDRIEQQDISLGQRLKQRALMLVGGEHTPPVPQGRQASTWIIQSGQADIFIGYRSYAHLLQSADGVVTVLIPEEWQSRADYGYAVCQPAGQTLAELLLTREGQDIFVNAGFGAAQSSGRGNSSVSV